MLEKTKDLSDIQKRLWAQIDLDIMENNFKAIRKSTVSGAGICCAIKADGYGLGAVRLARLYSELGADMLAVACIEEALELRRAGIDIPILILGFTPPACAGVLCEYGLSQSVYSYEYANELSECARAAGARVRSHIKIDSGMGRIGFAVREDTEDAYLDLIYKCATLEGIDPEGIFTHFCVSDGGADGEAFTKRQFDRFRRAFTYLEHKGVGFKYKHCANSAAIFDYPEYHLDMVRAGIALYGLAPSKRIKNVPNIKEALTLKTLITNIKTVKRGESVGYGRAYTADRDRRIATVPIGYADGLSRALSCGAMLFTVCKKPAPIVGRICMDQTMIDITDIEGAELFDEISVFGADALISIDECASALNTISYEVLTSISRRVPRVYIKDGRIESVSDYIL